MTPHENQQDTISELEDLRIEVVELRAALRTLAAEKAQAEQERAGRARAALEQQLISVQDEAAEIAGREEGHLNKVEQMRMRMVAAEAKLKAIAEACDKYYGWGGMIEKDAIRRLLQEG